MKKGPAGPFALLGGFLGRLIAPATFVAFSFGLGLATATLPFRFGRAFRRFHKTAFAAGIVDDRIERPLLRRGLLFSGLLRGVILRLGLRIAAALLLLIAVPVAIAAIVLAATLVAAALLVVLLLLLLLLLTLRVHLALRFGQHAGVMLRVLLEVFQCDAVIAKLRITGQLVVFVDDLLRGASHLAFRPRAVKHAVDDVSDRAVAVPFGPRAVLR